MLPVIISFGNLGYLDFVVNLLKNAHDVLRNHRMIMYCTDQETYDAVKVYDNGQITIRRYDVQLTTAYTEWGTKGAYVAIMRAKTAIIRQALEEHEYIHFVDADVVFCKEPTEDYYAAYQSYDIVYQLDNPPPNPKFSDWTCMGNMVLRNTAATRQFMASLAIYEAKYPTVADQDCQQMMFREMGVKDIRKYPGVKLTEFPMEEFTCGYLIKMDMVHPKTVMVFHANHVVGKQPKIDLLKKIGKWYLE